MEIVRVPLSGCERKSQGLVYKPVGLFWKCVGRFRALALTLTLRGDFRKHHGRGRAFETRSVYGICIGCNVQPTLSMHLTERVDQLFIVQLCIVHINKRRSFCLGSCYCFRIKSHCLCEDGDRAGHLSSRGQACSTFLSNRLGGRLPGPPTFRDLAQQIQASVQRPSRLTLCFHGSLLPGCRASLVGPGAWVLLACGPFGGVGAWPPV